MKEFFNIHSKKDSVKDVQKPAEPDSSTAPSSTIPTAEVTKDEMSGVGSDNLDETWKEVEDRVQRLAGKDTGNFKPSLQIADVIRLLDQQENDNQTSDKRRNKTKEVFTTTLDCITVIGGIVATAASAAFGPAQTCYNALTFVIEAWKGYEGIFESLTGLLQRCNDFMQRLEEYKSWLNTKLERVACKHLQLFVAICDRMILLRKTSSKIRAFAKVLFLKDDGVKDLLSLMDGLVDKEHNLVTALTYCRTSEIQKMVESQVESEGQRKQESEVKKWKKSLAQTLGFEQSMIDKEGEPIPSWTKTLTDLKNNLIDGTGTWILEDHDFNIWANEDGSSKPILVLYGEDGTGKTYTMANVLKHLSHHNGMARSVVSHIFMDSESKKEEVQEDVLVAISRSLLWQCAAASEALTKSMAIICKEVKEFDGTLGHWDKLFFGNHHVQKMDTMFYFGIDGVDEKMLSNSKFLKLLESFSSYRNAKIRLFLTAKTQTWRALKSVEGIDFNSINVSEKNHNDIETYIIHRMDAMDTLKDATRPGIPGWRQTILTTLQKRSAGDYFILATSLDSISKKDLIEDIQEVLDNVHNTRKGQIDAEIQKLQATLTVNEIREVNEIIQWLISAERWPSLNELDAVLAFVHGKHGSSKTSLLPLDKKLESKYLLFRVSGEGLVKWKSEEIEDRIPKKTISARDSTHLSGLRKVQDAEINIVEHFLKQVCPSDLFDKFDFQTFFDKKRKDGSENTIAWDEENAHINIAITCLKTLTEKRNVCTQELKNYAGQYLLFHLSKVDRLVADRVLKSFAGDLLVQLFTTDDGIDSLFWISEDDIGYNRWEKTENIWLAENRRIWLYTEEGMDQLQLWFNDTAAIGNITDENHKALISAFKDPETNRHEALLGPTAKRLATHLLRSGKLLREGLKTAVLFLMGYLSRINIYGDGTKFTEDSKRISIEDVEHLENWALRLFGQEAVDSIWEMNFGYIFSMFCEDGEEEAEARAQKALDLDPDNWLALNAVAANYPESEEGSKKAIKMLEYAMNKVDVLIHDDPKWLDDSLTHQKFLAIMTVHLGQRYWELGQDDNKAAQMHRKSLEYSNVDFDVYSFINSAYSDRGDWRAVIELCNALNSGDKWSLYFHELINDFILYEDNQPIFAQAAESTGRWDVIDTLFERAIDIAKKDNHVDGLFRLRTAYGFILQKSGKQEEKALLEWELAFKEGRDKVMITKDELIRLCENLARIYLAKGSEFRSQDDEANPYITKICHILLDLDPLRTVIVRCSLARLHSICKSVEEGKKAVAVIMDTVLKWLSDDNPFNDEDALLYLTYVVTTFGDERNTVAVLQLQNLATFGREKRRSERRLAQQPIDEKLITDGDAITHNEPSQIADTPDPAGTGPVASEQSVSDLEKVANVEVGLSVKERPETSEEFKSSGEYDEDRGEHCDISEANKTESMKSIDSQDEDIPSVRSEKRSRSSSSVSSDTDLSSGLGLRIGELSYSCDGCGEDWLYLSNIYTCSDCLGQVLYDEVCYQQFLKGELSHDTCHGKHSFIYIPAWSEEQFESLPEGCMVVGGETMPFDEWKRELKEQYLTSIS
ncbi:putative neutral amino acid permease protein [Fusarium austroafricanum]|uniref:Putative neutral amino acid permease protein n=1 Tax=Fusarium austroafricanum TaxID=2364996 RepID=A0A8H4KBG4_9HYPO|nr:putative neutral amino acid permease protein [Fusarium austroafricanum]